MGCQWIERHLVMAFHGYGRLVCRHPSPFLLIPLIFGIMVAAGILLIKTEVGVVMLFTPTTAPSRHEQIVARDFLSVKPIPDDHTGSPLDRLPYSADEEYADLWFNMQVAYKDRQNIMTPGAWSEIGDLLHFINNNFTCSTSDDPHGIRLPYNPDFCNPKRGCLNMEDYVSKVGDILNRSLNDNKTSGHIQLTYPIMKVYDNPFNWAQLIYGIERNETTGILKSARVVSLFIQFQYKRRDLNMAGYTQRCMRDLVNYLLDINRNNQSSNAIHYYPLSEPMFDSEVLKTKTYALPYLALTIGLVTAFTVFSSLTPGFLIGSAFESLMGVVTIGLSLMASFGFLFICGRYFNAIVIISPFLVMCVGIDNDFLLMAAYRQTNPKLPPEKRLGEAFSAAGPSLTITSITDVLCFGIGFLSDTPSVANFCLYTAVSLTFRYIYQLTFFAAIMAYVGRMEYDQMVNPNSSIPMRLRNLAKMILLRKQSTEKPPLPAVTTEQGRIGASEVVHESVSPDHIAHKFFKDYYAPFLFKKPVRVLAIVTYLIYIAVVIYGASRMIVNISPHKLVTDNSPLLEYFDLAERYSWSDSVLAHVFVNKVPDFRNVKEINEFYEFSNKLSNITEYVDPTTDPSETMGLWLKEYMQYLEWVTHIDTDPIQDFYNYLPDFLQLPDYKKYLMDMRFKPNPPNASALRIDKFRFSAFYRGVDNWEKHVDLMKHWRRICSEYSKYEAIVYDHHHLNIYLDQRLTLEPTTLHTSGIAILSMAFITAIFMPDIVSVFYICLSFLSVDLGVIGFLSLWGTELDPVTMVCVLMTIGFSVYYTARMCYCYRTLDQTLPPEQKLALTLGAVGWPIVQGGVATVLGIAPLALVPSHMVRVFFKTITLMVVIGLMHGLVTMPVIMCAFDRCTPPRRYRVRSNVRKANWVSC